VSATTKQRCDITLTGISSELNVTEADLREAKLIADQMSLSEVRTVSHSTRPATTNMRVLLDVVLTSKQLMENVLKLHARDPNFPQTVLDRIIEFLGQSARCITRD
jgi:hypothetical protein